MWAWVAVAWRISALWLRWFLAEPKEVLAHREMLVTMYSELFSLAYLGTLEKMRRFQVAVINYRLTLARRRNAQLRGRLKGKHEANR